MQDADGFLFRFGAAVVVALLSLLFKAVRRALLRVINRLLPVARVGGAWETEIDRGDGTRIRHETARLSQLGPWLWGLATRRDGNGVYKLRGHVTGDKVCVTYRAQSPGLDVGAALLKLAVGGKQMEGVEIGCDLKDGTVRSLQYFWTRQP